MVGEVWVPEFVKKPLARRGGRPDRYTAPKLLWHTWEGTNWNSAESTFRNYPPHLGVKVFETPRQYVPLNLHSYALKGSESDDEFVIQLELAGFASDSPDRTATELHWLGTEVVAPINRALAAAGLPTIPPVIVPAGFRGPGGGIVLASPNSPIRLSDREFESFSGHLGHQHAPAPDSHWDPGGLDVAAILRYAGTAPQTPSDDEDDMTPEDRQMLKEAWLMLKELQAEVVGKTDVHGQSRQDRHVKQTEEIHRKVVRGQ